MKTIELDFTIPEQTIEITENSEIIGKYLGSNSSEIKSRIYFVHKLPNIISRINIKAVVLDSAKFDFEGILKIEKGATSTDTYLKIDCLIMGEKAFARAIPSLEINESEVKGGHGATIGYLDPAQIYYLKSHGISLEQAEKMLVDAFFN